MLDKVIYVIRLSRYISQRENISLLTLFLEMLVLYITKRLGPLLYFEARLWRKGLSLRKKMRYFNESQYKRRINELNPEAYRKFSNNKLVEKSILTLLGIPTAEFIGYLHSATGSDCEGNQLINCQQFKDFLLLHDGEKLCFKLTEGWGGTGFLAVLVSKGEKGLYLSSLVEKSKKIPVNKFFDMYLLNNIHHGFVIESYIKQHDILANLNESSVNTLRVWVIQQDEKVKVVGALLRLGREGQLVDNSNQGGIICLLNLTTGKIKQGMTTGIIPCEFDRHPDSGAQLSGVQLPFWRESMNLAKSCLRVFPNTNFVGLDIAISVSGPIIVELNQEPDKVGARSFDQPHADLLRY
ncbi:hypothetical protein GAB14E_1414 [Colwellia psychrerythraea]|uniref:Alpha-L-glutamate ligase-related protein ATP-grasp domain-containing protein n=2 Tax=Colwellia psychrerythraea TaxID=28229 RepID=A0A099L261_COLPS|nr:hypothetical protein GAB14E_1414 [Colwellia psychrerythraea]